jgi:hypothetical protein
MKNKVERDFNFSYFKSFNIEDIKTRVEKFSQEWEIDTSRQSTVYEGRPNPHVNTNTYIIQNSSLYWEKGTSFSKETLDKDMYDLVYPIVKELEDRMVGQSARILLIKLNANSKVFVHKDSGDYLSSVRRFHIPLITNDKVSYTVGGEEIHMEEGKCYEINNLKLHSVDNNSEYDRVHILIDIMPECETKIIGDKEKDLKVYVIKDFITQEDADILIDYIQKNYLNDEKFYTPEKAKINNRFRYESHVPEIHSFANHTEIIDLLTKYSDKFLLECINLFKDKDLFLTAQWLTMLGEGTRLPAHVDNHIDAEHLFRSGVIYLNNDFDGGFLKFLDLDITIDPEKLSIVIFESTKLHEITEIINGTRIAMPIWATNIKERGINNG